MKNKTKTIRVRDFTDAPFGTKDGRRFRTEHIMPYIKEYDKIIIDLDGTYGYPVGFIREAFGKIILEVGMRTTVYKIQFLSTEDKKLSSRIWRYMADEDFKTMIKPKKDKQ